MTIAEEKRQRCKRRMQLLEGGEQRITAATETVETVPATEVKRSRKYRRPQIIVLGGRKTDKSQTSMLTAVLCLQLLVLAILIIRK